MNLESFVKQLQGVVGGTFHNIGNVVSALTGIGEAPPPKPQGFVNDPIAASVEKMHNEIISDAQKSQAQDAAYNKQMSQLDQAQKILNTKGAAQKKEATLIQNYLAGNYDLPTTPGYADTNVGSSLGGINNQSLPQYPGLTIPSTPAPIAYNNPNYSVPGGNVNVQLPQTNSPETYARFHPNMTA